MANFVETLTDGDAYLRPVSALQAVPGPSPVSAPPRARSAAAAPLEERAWLAQHVQGDPQAFRRLVDTYGGAIYGYICRCGVPHSVRDDLFQDVFLKVHRAAARYDAQKPLKPWLFTIAANTVRSWFRSRTVFDRFFTKDDREAGSPLPGVHASVEARELATYVDEALRRLPMAQRQVVLLVCLEGMALDEVAAALVMPLNTVKTNLQRGRRTLTKALERRSQVTRREGG